MEGIIAVGISSSPNSSKLLRWAQAMSQNKNVEWYAIHVDNGALLSQSDQKRLETNIALAESMGARIISAVGTDIAKTFIATAKALGATFLVVGRSGLYKRGILHRQSLSERILRNADNLNVVIVSDDNNSGLPMMLSSFIRLFSAPWKQYMLLFVAFIFVTLFCFAFQPILDRRSVALIYLAAVLLLSLVSGPAPVVLMAAISSIAYNFLFIPPRFTLSIASAEDVILFVLYILVAGVVGYLSAGLRSREKMLLKRDNAASFLLYATNQLSSQKSLEDAARTASQIVNQYTGTKSVVYLEPWNDLPEIVVNSDSDTNSIIEIEDAHACIIRNAVVQGAKYRFVPAYSSGSPVAAIGYLPPSSEAIRLLEIDQLLIAFGRSLALFVERARSEALSKKAALDLESERLAKVLFDSVSHELKTPLTSITGSLSALKDSDLISKAEIRDELVDNALQSAEHLSRIVDSLLSISRIESGSLKLKLEPTDVAELARKAEEAVTSILGNRKFTVQIKGKTRQYLLDSLLVSKVIMNLLENACRYSNPGGPIELELNEKENGLSILVRDSGPGFSAERMRHPFVKFARHSGDKKGGLGLGLAISRGIVEAHGGHLIARKYPLGFEIEAIFPQSKVGENGASTDN